MQSIGTSPSHGDRRFRGFYGVSLFAALTAWTVFANPTVFATPGGGNTTVTTTTSTTSHTASGCPSRAEQTLTTVETFGPQTIFIGEDQSVPFFVAAGTINFNTNTDTTTFICALLAPALGPGALAVCAVLLAAYAIRRGHRSRHHPPIDS